MSKRKITLRSTQSPYNDDVTKGSVLSHNELDTNQINLKGEIIYTATTSGSTLSLKKLNGDEILADVGESVDISYNRDEQMIINVGGAIIGTTFSGTVMDALDTILYPFVQPTTTFSITSMSMSSGISSAKLFEKGGVVSEVNMNYGVSVNSGIFINHSIQRGANTPDVITTPLSGTFTKTGLSITWNDVLADRTFTKTTSFSNTTPVVKSDNITFVAPSFFGVGSVDLLDTATTVVHLASLLPGSKEVRAVRAKSNVNFNPVLQRYFFVYPASLGLLTLITDQNNFNVTPSFNLTTKNITLIDGVTTESYNIYISNSDTTQTDFKINFS